MERKRRKIDVIAEICRIILAAVFIFSGFMKTIDTWGTAVKMREYFSFLHIDWLSDWSVGLGIWLCAAELMMGCMLLFKVRLRLVSIFSFATMSFFTVLTLIIAIFNPLDDCGCFGAALSIENWHSFFKNLILLPMSIIVWYSQRGKKILNFTKKEIVLTILFATLAGSLGVYSYYNLPPIDMFPYKKGVKIGEDVTCTKCVENSTRLIYLDKETGREVEFMLSDTTWYDSERWEYVSTRTPFDDLTPEQLERDFGVYWQGMNIADEIASAEGATYLVFVRDMDRLKGKCRARVEKYVKERERNGDNVMVVTLHDIDTPLPANCELGECELRLCSMEGEVMSMMLRANTGVVIIENGIVKDKRTCWNMK